jgi:hypothetical protein
MKILATRYGYTRPRAITAMLQRLQTALPSVPVLETVPRVAPKAAALVARVTRAQVAQWQAERAQLKRSITVTGLNWPKSKPLKTAWPRSTIILFSSPISPKCRSRPDSVALTYIRYK